MKIAIASDHAGFRLKEEIIKFLESRNVGIINLGTYSEESVDYPDYAEKVADAITERQADKGILVCGTGIGMSVSANKRKGIVAALVYSDYTAEMAAKHNRANVIALGARTMDRQDAIRYVEIWMSTSFEGGRHENRIKKVLNIERERKEK
ncbi:MAG: ribose 5-phosphate isomerase B [Deltaproteobacteria bacterium]|nr:ribose 5-phosphate isomerase B [Deltaproteobacteria bacterium]